MIQWIFSDMDGTLLDEQKRLPKAMFPLLAALNQKGIHFAVASGRQYYNLYEYFGSYASKMLFIAENGAMMFKGEQCIDYTEIATVNLGKAIAHIRQLKNAWPVVCGVESAYVENDDPQFLANCRLYYRRLQYVKDVLSVIHRDPICKISIFDALDAQTHGLPWLQKKRMELHTVTSGKHWIDMTNPNVNKGSAVAAWKHKNGLSSAQLMAFGDYLNDREMLLECEASYAMGNAHPDILKIARHHAKSNGENGVIAAICDYFHISLS
ncbi:MAG: HAD family hydrolase [Erysipelotrichaceae bacterium]|nr:HAD family hydrolase [Erysipelotrichaceae bacterium]